MTSKKEPHRQVPLKSLAHAKRISPSSDFNPRCKSSGVSGTGELQKKTAQPIKELSGNQHIPVPWGF